MQKLISFCIPTLDNHKYISQTLSSIFNHSKIDDIEIIIGDSSKGNKTKDIIDNFKLKFSNITYIKIKQRKGFDLDFEKTISYSSAKFCWFLSSDDTLVPGAIDLIRKELIKDKEVYLFNRLICNLDLKIIKKSSRWIVSKKSRNFFYSNKKDCLEYIKLGNSIGCLFSYMSSIIVKKKEWDKVPSSSYFFKKKIFPKGYMHSVKIIYLLFKKNFCLRYIAKDLIYFRGDNDSFKKEGYFNRINIDFDGYRVVNEFFFKKNKLKLALKDLMRKEHKFYYLLRYRSECFDMNDRKKLLENLKYYNYPNWQIYFIDFFGKSKLFVTLLRYIRKFFL